MAAMTNIPPFLPSIVIVKHYEDLREVILVGHSYGGMVITGAADRAAGRVGRLVYLDAANTEPRAVAGALLEIAAA
jgi:pimeloyl-ACP methyl ester carboxylesterase